MKKQHGFGVVGIIIIIFVLASVGTTGWLVLKNKKVVAPTSTNQNTDAESEEDQDGLVAHGPCKKQDGFSSYFHDDESFCFVYPESWGEVTIQEGIMDASLENGKGYVGFFTNNQHASFAVQTPDWEYVGGGRGGPNHASGFTAYSMYVVTNPITEKVKLNTAEQQLVAFSTDFNFNGVVVTAKMPFDAGSTFAGIEFNINVPATGGFNGMQDNPEDIVDDATFEQMTAVLDSVVDL